MKIQPYQANDKKDIVFKAFNPLTKTGLLYVAQRENDLIYHMPPEQLRLTIDNLWGHLTKLKESFAQHKHNKLIRLKLLLDENYIIGIITPKNTRGYVIIPSENASGYIFTDGANFQKAVKEATTKFLKEVLKI